MPEFSAEAWTSFKQQFVSVIQFIMYCFDMFFDACRANPLLYALFFFPIFALAFFAILELLLHLAPFVPILNSTKVEGAIGYSRLHASGKGSNLKSLNLAAASHVKRAESLSKSGIKSVGVKLRAGERAAAKGEHAAVNIRSTLSAAPVSTLGTHNQSGLAQYGVDVGANVIGKFKEDVASYKARKEAIANATYYSPGPQMYGPDTQLATFEPTEGPKPYSSYSSLKEWLPEPSGSGNKNANLDINPD